jgi:hypothetical protein
MIAAIYDRIVGAALCWLLALATSAGADVLWERATEDPEPSAFTSLGVFGTERSEVPATVVVYPGYSLPGNPEGATSEKAAHPFRAMAGKAHSLPPWPTRVHGIREALVHASHTVTKRFKTFMAFVAAGESVEWEPLHRLGQSARPQYPCAFSGGQRGESKKTAEGSDRDR